MNLQFVDSYPYRRLEPELDSLFLRSIRVDAAVAFVTRPGVALLRQYLKAHQPGSARLTQVTLLRVAIVHGERTYGRF